MRIQLTVRGPAAGPDREVVVECASGARAQDLAAALGGQAVVVAGRRLPQTAPLGLPPLLDGAVVVVDGPAAPLPATSVWELCVDAGPDVGLTFPLPVGSASVGRSERATVSLTDPLVSRRHAQVDVGPGTPVSVRDLGGTNGTWVCGVRVPESPRRLAVGDVLELGGTRLRLRPVTRAAPVRPDGEGHLVVPDSGPKRTPPDEVVTFPSPPSASARPPFPLLALAVPMVLAGVLALVMQSPTMLLFGLTGPVLSLATWLADRRRRRSSGRGSDPVAGPADARAALDRALLREREVLEWTHPPLVDVLTSAESRTGSLWRRDDGQVRVGVGVRRSAVRLDGEAAPPPPSHPHAPVTVDLSAVGTLGVCGGPDRFSAAAGIIARLATSAPPSRLQLAVVVTEPGHEHRWGFAARLPHTRFVATAAQSRAPVDAVLVEITRREDADRVRAPPGQPVFVLVIDGWPTGAEVHRLEAVLHRGPAVGVVAVVLAATRRQLPSCGAVLALEAAAGLVSFPGAADGGDDATQVIAPDLPSPRWVTRVSRALAPLREGPQAGAGAGVHGELPQSVRLLDLVGEVDHASVVARWRAGGASTRAVVGVAAAGPLALDLALDGPHALIAGTTGAGKSELLQTLVCSLALANRPDEMTFLLVDYKGGAAFRGCARLPHVVGVVTDLDGHLTARALTSLAAELRRRERLLADAGAGTLEEYRRTRARDPGRPALPRLVIAIDEFRVLAEELPDFVHGLVRLAAVGRSLGVHLVLATQRPGGIVSADIRANVSLRIALRVRDRTDSVDVLDDPDAASIDATTPGRASLKGAASPLTRFQSARVTSGPPPTRRLTVTETGVGWPGAHDAPALEGGEHPPGTGPDRTGLLSGGDRDLDRIVEAARAAGATLGIAEPPRPWLPPLPDLLTLRALGAGATAWSVPVGLEDVPDEQRQSLWSWSLRDGHLGIAGGGRSGRTTAVLTLAMQLATAMSPAALHLYAIGPPELAALAALPHTVAVADVDDPDQVRLVVERLGGQRLGEHPRAADRPARPVLLVDGWERLSGHGSGGLAVQVRSLLEGSATSGLRAVVTGGRALLAGQLVPVLSQRLVLALGDPVDLAMAGIPRKAVPVRQPPGRALDAGTHREVHLATLADGPTEAARLVSERWTRGIPPGARSGWARPIRRLPDTATLPVTGPDDAPHDAPRGGLLAVGVRDGDLAVVGFRPAQGERRILVIGPPGSGRTTALHTLVDNLAAAGARIALVTTAHQRLHHDVLVLTGHGDGDVERLVTARRAYPDLVVVIDDAERLSGLPIEPVLLEIARRVDEDRGIIVAATSPLALDSRTTALGADVARAHTGVVLWPSAGSAVLGPGSGGTESPVRIPGRGLLVSPSGVERIQVATVSRPR